MEQNINQNETYRFEIEENEESLSGARLDKALSTLVGDELSRGRVQALIAEGQCALNGEVFTNASRKMREGDVIELNVPPPVEANPQAEDIPLDVVYEDEALLVVNKPVGLIVHPGAGNPSGTLVNALLYHCGDSLSGIGGVLRPGIVHRLDKETSGLMVVAKTDIAHRGLAEQLADRSLSRTYEALVCGIPVPLKSTIDQPIGRHPTQRQKMAVLRRNAKEARTHYHVLERFEEACALVECKLESGRTHQIRVHMAHAGYPLIGDPLYGPQPTALNALLKKSGYEEEVRKEILAFPRQALHAKALAFIHPVSQEAMAFDNAAPADFQKLLTQLARPEMPGDR